MSKHIYTNTSEQSTIRDIAQQTARLLTNVLQTWNALNIGEFTDELLNGDPSRSPTSTCQSCKGLRNYTKGELMIQDYLLDLAGSVTVGGGLRLSRERLRDVIEMPDAEKIKAFEKAFRAYSTGGPFGNLPNTPFVEIQNGQVVILQEEMEAYCNRFEKHLSDPEDIQLHDDVEQFLALLKSINERATKKGMAAMALHPDTAKGRAPIKTYPGNWGTEMMIDNALLTSYLH